jgi:hypothetical protein
MYKTAFSRLLLVLLFIVFFLLPESVCLAIGFQDIQRIINDNRTLLKNIDVEIVQYRNDDIEPIYREKWTIFSDKFRNEWQLDLTEPDNTGSKHTHELHTSNGQVEAHAYFHEKRGFVHTATPQS